jgi:cytochrome c5
VTRRPSLTRSVLAAAATLLASAVWSSAPALSARAPGDDLPDAPGKKILVRACTTCHDLDEVTKFKGYYTRSQWKDIVVTMREYGAAVDEAEVEPLADYLFAAVGKRE